MSRSAASIERRVMAAVAEAAGVPASEVRVDSDLAAIGMGSLERLECVFRIEDAFEVELEESDLRRLRTVRDLVMLVEQATGPGPQA